MVYKTVFDVSNESSANFWPFMGAAPLIILGWCLVYKPNAALKLMPYVKGRLSRRIIAWTFFLGATISSILGFLILISETLIDKKMLRSGHYSVVEGVVTKFVPMPKAGHSRESFIVGDQRFSYSDYDGTAAFRNTASHGGLIREGLNVRISYVGNSILRLEIAE